MTELNKIIDIIKKLRDPKDGCPWDRKQTHYSLLPYLLEESYELVEAINSKNKKNIKEELGDVLLQILLHAEIASEKNDYDIKDVINSLADKLVRRHPHVFKKKKKLNKEQLKAQWNKIKKLEGKRDETNNPFSEINSYMPIMLKTIEIGKISSEFKFDWNDYKGPLSKVKEELNEVIIEKKKKKINQKKIDEEIGDLLFSVINLARHLNVNPEISLMQSNKKFIKRFNLMTASYGGKEKFINAKTKKKEEFWNKAKKTLK